jgi:hypothetical protein
MQTATATPSQPSPPRAAGRAHPARSRIRRAVVPLGIAGAVAVAGVTVGSASATPSADAVIAEVYGGGGNAGSTYASDFVELADAAGSAFDLDGYSMQYLTGSPGSTSRWRVTALNGTLPAGGRYLVQEWGNIGGTTPLPTPDAVGDTNLSATSGTVALVAGTTPLTCRTQAACAEDPRVKDLLGYGTAAVHEGSSPAQGAGNITSVARNTSLRDTDDNAADFAASLPSPQNSASGGGTDDGGSSVGPTGGTDDGGTVGVIAGVDGTTGSDSGSVNGGGTDDGGSSTGSTGGGWDDGGTVGVTGS